MVKRKDELESKLKAFIDLVSKSFYVEAVVLFGSYARENPGEYSDIDVAVFSPEFGKNPLKEMADLCKLRRKVDTDIEPLPFSAKDFYEHTKADFVHEIIEHGKIIYNKGKVLI